MPRFFVVGVYGISNGLECRIFWQAPKSIGSKQTYLVRIQYWDRKYCLKD